LPNTIFLTQEVKEFVEHYLRENNPKLEHGGFLLGRNYQAIIPRFYPNMSSTPHRQYRIPTNWEMFLRCDKQLFNMDWAIFFHLHPTHSIPSEVDLKRANFYTPIEMLIMYDEEKNSFSWRAFDKKGIEQYIDIVDKNYPIFQRYFANSLNLLNVGSCYITPNGDVLCSNSLGRAFITIDMDALIVYKFVKKNGVRPKVQMKDALNISTGRITKALEKLKKNELI